MPEFTAWPDFFGHAYSVLADDCFAAMAEGKLKLFEKLFPAYFTSALAASEKLRQKSLQSSDGKLRGIGEPLVDLMEISGYSAVLAELDQKPYWSMIETCWSKYFSAITDVNHRRLILQLFCTVAEPTGHVDPRYTLRFRWKRNFEDILYRRGIIPDRRLRYDCQETEIPRHESALVRAFSYGIKFMSDAHEVFLAIYLFKRPEAAGVNKPYRVKHFERTLAREQARRASPS